MSLSQTETGLTKKKAADFMGVSPRQVERYVESGMPREGHGVKARFGKAAFAWHRDFLLSGREVGKLQEEMARKTQIDADRAQLKLLKEQSELVPIRMHREYLEKAFSIIRMRLLAVAGKITPIIWGSESKAKMKAKIESEIYEILTELAAQGKK